MVVKLIGSFRIDYKYEMEDEFDFSNLQLVSLVSIITCHTNVFSRVSLSAGKQRVTGRSESSKDVTDLKFESRTRTQSRALILFCKINQTTFHWHCIL